MRAREIEDLGLDGMRARVTTPAGERFIETPLLGRGNLANVLAATAVALEFGIAARRHRRALPRLRPADRRGAVRRLARRRHARSTTRTTRARRRCGARSTWSRTRAARARKVAVLGEMLELGDHALALHEECGRAAAAAGLDGCSFAIGGAPARAPRRRRRRRRNAARRR